MLKFVDKPDPTGEGLAPFGFGGSLQLEASGELRTQMSLGKFRENLQAQGKQHQNIPGQIIRE